MVLVVNLFWWLIYNFLSLCFTGCSTVLVPARVVQALKLNIDDMCAPQPPHLQRRFNASYNPEYGKILNPLLYTVSSNFYFYQVDFYTDLFDFGDWF